MGGGRGGGGERNERTKLGGDLAGAGTSAPPYDPTLDRMDVALRALFAARNSGKWPLLERVGLSRKADDQAMDTILLEVATLRTEAGLFKAVARHPRLVGAADRLLRLYWTATVTDRHRVRYSERLSGRAR